MKTVNKVIALSAFAIALSAPLNVLAQGSRPQSYPGTEAGCTREYDPVPYVTKTGETITAPNRCVADQWKAEGK